MTSTDTKAKRTEGELHTEIANTAVGCTCVVESDLQIVAECYGSNHAANAEYIRKAWNMHEELVAGIQRFLHLNDFGGCADKSEFDAWADDAWTLLSKAQQ